eukprot:389561_1
MLQFEYEETGGFGAGAYWYDKFTITGAIAVNCADDNSNFNLVDRMKKLCGLVGEAAFIDSIFDVRTLNTSAMDCVVSRNGYVNALKYLMGIEGVKARCMANTGLWELLH